jgi:hypothetical protein
VLLHDVLRFIYLNKGKIVKLEINDSKSNTLDVCEEDDLKLRIIDNFMNKEIIKNAPNTRLLKEKVPLTKKTEYVDTTSEELVPNLG